MTPAGDSQGVSPTTKSAPRPERLRFRDWVYLGFVVEFVGFMFGIGFILAVLAWGALHG